jgi:C4-dicarboxylate-specific signal transduction histidine kinase
MVHEFNTPLQAIKFIAQSINRFLDENKISPEEIKKNLERGDLLVFIFPMD